MMWIIGIDEAGYGPNLGPFVMTAVACRVPDCRHPVNLWHLLHPAVRRCKDADGGQLLIDDSKRVYAAYGLAGLERGVLAFLVGAAGWSLRSVAALLDWICPDDGDELRREVWYRGVGVLPVVLDGAARWQEEAARFKEACAAANVEGWQVRSVVICPRRFNALLDEGGTKGHVLAHALTYLLRWNSVAHASGSYKEDNRVFFIDKHGGRNAYAAMIQYALPDANVFIERESKACSAYRVHVQDRDVCLFFQPRADGEYFCVALASMISKYLRELLMLEFNRFWREHVPGLKPTAGYPGDAVRFLRAIRSTIETLGLHEETLWRRK